MRKLAQHLFILPWLKLKQPIFCGGFWFKPVSEVNAAEVVGAGIGPTMQKLLRSYVGLQGQPIDLCTLVLRRNHPIAWDIPPSAWRRLHRAVDVLMLSHLSEQRFYERFSAHMNTTMFQMFGHGVSANSDHLSLHQRRRGMSLLHGGLRYKDVHFQQPYQINQTESGPFNGRLARSLTRLRTLDPQLWQRVEKALEFFRLAHSEDPQRDWNEACMLAAMSFEKLLGTPANSAAFELSKEFTTLFSPFDGVLVEDAKRVKPDAEPKDAASQRTWRLHQKWMKELYELRSALAHKGRNPKRSVNWTAEQHIVIAAFAFGLAVKVLLCERGLYALSDEEKGACDALDRLLDSDWGRGWKKPPEWPSILSRAEQSRGIRSAVIKALGEVGDGLSV